MDDQGFPWSCEVERFDANEWTNIFVSPRADFPAVDYVLGVLDAKEAEVAAVEMMVRSVNILGPHLSNPRFIAAVESLSRLGEKDPERLGQLLDWIEEHVG